MPRLRLDQYLAILVLAASFLLLPSNAVGQARAFPQKLQFQMPQLISPITAPVYTASPSTLLDLQNLTATSIYVMDRQSGAILYQKNATDPRYPASTAKMMTALLTRELYPLDQTFTVKEEAFATGSVIHFQVGEQLKVRDLLYALLISSGNDAAFVLANNHPAGYQGFVQAMNQRARELHLNQTTFRNPSGLDVQDQVSTARDLAILANELMKDPFLREIVGTSQTTITDVTGQHQHLLKTTDQLLGFMPGVVGIKTGTTDLAGQNLITEVDRDGHQIIAVVLNSKDRFTEARMLIDWVWAHYRWQQF